MANVEALRLQAEASEVKFGIVDLTARTWYMPDTKNQREHTIHLSEFALMQFERLHDARLRRRVKIKYPI